MSAEAAAYDPSQAPQRGHDNPALNAQAFQRGIAAAPAAERAGMTVTGTYVKTGFLLVLLIAAGAFGWSQVEIRTINGQEIAIQPTWTWLAILLTLVFGFAGIFAFQWIPLLAIGYALSEGALLGIAAHAFDLEWDGIVLQAIVATIAVFTATLLLYGTGVIKVTSKLAMGVAIAMGGLLVLWTTTWLLSLFGLDFSFWSEPSPWGIGLSVLIVILAALNLPLDFAFIERSAAAGAPKQLEWYGAFGLMLSIIWMYVAILRLLALLRASQ
ncbi:MAG TPA: Bax inhibitor-1/YccA family protein [Thermomicrobiales bacterium]|jgi:uncharacterized YccA/Bax inhibitor family protein